MTKTVIGLLRHGQTNWNIDFRLQGVTDIPLNETGIAQAKVAGAVIASQAAAGQPWDLILTSPLSRARDTAVMVGQAIGIEGVSVEELLLERSFGEAEGLTHAEWKTSFPDGHPPGGESLEELRLRAGLLLDHLANQYRGTRALAVSHGAMIRKIVRIVSKGTLPLPGERFENTSLTVLRHDQDGWKVHSYNPKSLGRD